MCSRLLWYIAGGIPARRSLQLFVFLPSFVFVLGGVHYIEKVRETAHFRLLRCVSAAVVGYRSCIAG